MKNCKSCHRETSSTCGGCKKPICAPSTERWRSCSAEAGVALAEAHGCEPDAALCEYCQGLLKRLKTASERPRKNMMRWRKGADVVLSQLAEMLGVIDGWSAETFREKVGGKSQKRFRITHGSDSCTFGTKSFYAIYIDTEGKQAGYRAEGAVHLRQWLNDRGLVDDVCAALGMPTVAAEKEAKRLKRRRDENRQTCPVCFRDICINSADTEKGVMVNHGYERPGCGYIIGNLARDRAQAVCQDERAARRQVARGEGHAHQGRRIQVRERAQKPDAQSEERPAQRAQRPGLPR
jgi:hypothetical protein